MSKEQTPITAEELKQEYYNELEAHFTESEWVMKEASKQCYLIAEQYAQAKVLEAIEPMQKEIEELKKIAELMKSDIKFANSLLKELKHK